MHREVLRTKAPQIDHRDRNGLNNRKGNLRSARAWQNAHNRPTYKNKTGFKGVYRDKRGFAAQIRIKGRLYCLGVFNTAEEAALAYNLKAKEGVRGFAWLNPGAAKFITARKPKVYARVTAIGYRGISMVRKLYYVRVKVRGKYVYCKYFRTVSDAVAAYNAEVIKHWGLMDAILNPLLPT